MCGIVGQMSRGGPVAPQLYTGCIGLQHRGKSGAGMAVSCNGKILAATGFGELPQAFHSTPLEVLPGKIGIAQLRYGTTGDERSENLQPIKGNFRGDDFYLVHNGNLVNLSDLGGCDWPGCSDTQVIVNLVSGSRAILFEDALLGVLPRLEGAFNFLFLYRETIFAATDRFGFHPLQLGDCGDSIIIASESSAFWGRAISARDILPGQLVILNKDGYIVNSWSTQTSLKIDLFEFIYFARPDSVIHGVPVGLARRAMGKALWRSSPLGGVDVIFPIPDSGNEAALVYYRAMLEDGGIADYEPNLLIRPHGVGRTFIAPIEHIRNKELGLKFVARPECTEGKSIVGIDDSLVRAFTSKKIVPLLRNAGAREFHLLLSSPMYLHPDYYGVDTYRNKGELIAQRLGGDAKDIAHYCNYDSVAFLDVEATIDAVLAARQPDSPLTKDSFYTGPFTGQYPAGTGDYGNK